MDAILLWPKFEQTLDEANEYTDTKVGQLSEGLTYKGSVATVSALPASGTKGDCYNVTDGSGMYAWDGSAWGQASVPGPAGEDGTDGEDGAAAGFGTPSATIDSNVGTPEVTVTATGPDTAKVFAFDFKNLKGTPGTDGKVTDVYSVYNSTKTSYLDSNNEANLTTITDSINNLKNIGRFLSIWNATTGLPTTNPTENPYSYKTGDYYRVGTVASSGGTNYKPNGATYTQVASTTVETEDIDVGYVYYYDGTNWMLQSAGGGGLVQDVQVNNGTILDTGTGIANINLATGLSFNTSTKTLSTNLSEVKYTTQSLTTSQQGIARNNIGAVALEAYDSTATPVDNVLYYVAE